MWLVHLDFQKLPIAPGPDDSATSWVGLRQDGDEDRDPSVRVKCRRWREPRGLLKRRHLGHPGLRSVPGVPLVDAVVDRVALAVVRVEEAAAAAQLGVRHALGSAELDARPAPLAPVVQRAEEHVHQASLAPEFGPLEAAVAPTETDGVRLPSVLPTTDKA